MVLGKHILNNLHLPVQQHTVTLHHEHRKAHFGGIHFLQWLFFPTSLCGVLVFDSVSRVLPPPPAASLTLTIQNLTYNNFTYKNFTHTNVTYNNFTHTNLTYNNFTYNNFTHRNLTYNTFTYNNFTHTQT